MAAFYENGIAQKGRAWSPALNRGIQYVVPYPTRWFESPPSSLCLIFLILFWDSCLYCHPVWRTLDLSRALDSSPGTAELTKSSELKQFNSALQTVFSPVCTRGRQWQFSSITNMLCAKSVLSSSCLACANGGAWTIQKKVWKRYYIALVPNHELTCKANLWKGRAILLPPVYKKALGLNRWESVLFLLRGPLY